MSIQTRLLSSLLNLAQILNLLDADVHYFQICSPICMLHISINHMITVLERCKVAYMGYICVYHQNSHDTVGHSNIITM